MKKDVRSPEKIADISFINLHSFKRDKLLLRFADNQIVYKSQLSIYLNIFIQVGMCNVVVISPSYDFTIKEIVKKDVRSQEQIANIIRRFY